MADKLQQFYLQDSSMPQYIIPMPLHNSRLRERGFNQALELTRYFHKQSQIPIALNIAKRLQATKMQSLMDSTKQRVRNVRNAFQSSAVQDKHILVIDDVITTGATISSLCKELRRNGAQRIDVACVARTAVNKSS